MNLAAILVLTCIISTALSKSIRTVKENATTYSASDEHSAGTRVGTSKDHVSINDKIVGGDGTKPGVIPWQASIKTLYADNRNWQYRHICGASIIGEFWLISAAHCFIRSPNFKWQVTVGEVSMSKEDPGEQVFEVENIYNHELYGKEKRFDSDVALIKIKPSNNGRGIKFSKFVKNICIYRYAAPPVNTLLKISGWGGLERQPSETQSVPDILQSARIPLLDQRECEEKYPNLITDRMFCAGYPDEEINVCHGDSGGPVVYEAEDDHILYGISSWVAGCAIPDQPAVFARVAAFYEWIKNVTDFYSDNINQRQICME